MYYPKYAMFFDFHTMKACPDVGHKFDAEKFASTLEEAGVDYIGFHAKCNQGFSYYDTEIGIRHPSLPENFDLFGETVSACNRHGIQVSAYLNCGLSNEVAVRHPEWCQIGENKQIYHPEILKDEVTPYMRLMCINSPYRDYFLSQVEEIADKYPVAGFLFDSFNAFRCVCPHCIEGMRKAGMDFTDSKQVKKFACMSAVRMAEDIAAVLRRKNPELLHYYLGLNALDNARIGSYMECECLPTNPVWGYDLLPAAARSLRLLTDGPVLNMTGRFYDWGDFGSIRTQAAVEYDLFQGLANGMRPNISDHLLPSGELNKEVYKLVGAIYSHLKQYDPWFTGAKTLAEIGVVIPIPPQEIPADRSPSNSAIDPAQTKKGVTRLLAELKYQFEIVNEHSDWSRYRLLVLPDNIRMTEELSAKLEAFMRSGGAVLATGDSGFDEDGKTFRLENEFGIKYAGAYPYDPAYFKTAGAFSADIPDMPLAARTSGVLMEPCEGTEVVGTLIRSYYNREWDGIYSYFYTPPAEDTGKAVATVRGRNAFCTFPVFQSYFKAASPEIRTLIRNIVEAICPDMMLKIHRGLPSSGRAFVSAKDKLRIIHLLNYVPELRGNMLIVEEEACAKDIEFSLKVDPGFEVARVYLAPGKTALDFTVREGRVHVAVPEVSGYAMIVVEAK